MNLFQEKKFLPPFSRLIAIIISANSQSLSLREQKKLKNLKKINGLEVMGPVDSPLLKIKKKYRSRLLIRFEDQSLKQKLVSKTSKYLENLKKIKLTVDVDPVNFG